LKLNCSQLVGKGIVRPHPSLLQVEKAGTGRQQSASGILPEDQTK